MTEVKLERVKPGIYTAWSKRFSINRVQSMMDSDYYYCITDNQTDKMLRGPSRRLDDVRETIERYLLKEKQLAS